MMRKETETDYVNRSIDFDWFVDLYSFVQLIFYCLLKCAISSRTGGSIFLSILLPIDRSIDYVRVPVDTIRLFTWCSRENFLGVFVKWLVLVLPDWIIFHWKTLLTTEADQVIHSVWAHISPIGRAHRVEKNFKRVCAIDVLFFRNKHNKFPENVIFLSFINFFKFHFWIAKKCFHDLVSSYNSWSVIGSSSNEDESMKTTYITIWNSFCHFFQVS